MIEYDELNYYDAHVKTHQRHILLSWLEKYESKKDKILNAHDLIPKKRLDLPEIQVSDSKLEYIPTINDEGTEIPTYNDIAVGYESVGYIPNINLRAFDYISAVNNLHIDSSQNLNFNLDIERQLDGVNLVSLSVPEKSENINFDFGKTDLSVFSSAKINVPEKMSEFNSLVKIDDSAILSKNDLSVFSGTKIDIAEKISEFKPLTKIDDSTILSKNEIKLVSSNLNTDIKMPKITDGFLDITKIEPKTAELESYSFTLNDEGLHPVLPDVKMIESDLKMEIDSDLFSSVNIQETVLLPKQIDNLENHINIDDHQYNIFKAVNIVPVDIALSATPIRTFNIDESVNVSTVTVPKKNNIRTDTDFPLLREINLQDIDVPYVRHDLINNIKPDASINIELRQPSASKKKIDIEFDSSFFHTPMANREILIPDRYHPTDLNIDIKTDIDTDVFDAALPDKINIEKVLSNDAYSITPPQKLNMVFPDTSDIMSLVQNERDKLTNP